MHYMQISLDFLFWAGCRSEGDVDSRALSLEHQGHAAPSDPRISAAL